VSLMTGSPHRPPLDPAVLAKLSGLELRARTIVEGHLTGLHRSPRQGFSVEFAEHREYAPGDDLRYLDWKVFGKRDRFYLKQFEEETNFACELAVDVSESMAYRSAGAPLTKFEYASCLAASLAWLVLRQQDAVGLVTIDDAVRTTLRPSGQAAHLKPLTQTLEQAALERPSALGRVLGELAERFRRRSVVLLVSDLFDDPAALAQGLRHLRFRGHDVGVLQVVDPAEEEFPFVEPTEFIGLEGQGTEGLEPLAVRSAYQAAFARFRQQIAALCRDLGVRYAYARTDAPPDRTLREFLTAGRAGR